MSGRKCHACGNQVVGDEWWNCQFCRKAEVPGGIGELELNTRAWHCLLRSKITLISQVSKLTDRQLLRIEHMGRVSIREIREAIAKHANDHFYNPDIWIGATREEAARLLEAINKAAA